MRQAIRFLLLGLMTVVAVKAFSQMPVQVTPQLLPPYSLQVSEYYSGVQPKLQVLLINRDINQPNIQVKLRMTVESQNCRMRTKDNAQTPTLTLTNGIPYYLTPQELQPFFSAANIDFTGGYSEQEYVQTGRFPEGLYSFYFEAFELYSGNLVSNKGFSLAWLTLADPPLLNTPAKAEGVAPASPQNIIFNWTPRHNTSPTAAYFTDYVFTLVEYNDTQLGPEASFTSSPPLFIDSVQTATTMLFGPGHPQLVPGKRYAWRVQAKAKAGAQQLAMFRNNGFSEVHWFTYQNNCAIPLGISATVQGQRVTIEWQNNIQHLEYKVEYREKNNVDAQWFTVKNTLPRVMLTDLKPGTQYEYRVGGSCMVGQFSYSALLGFTTSGANANYLPGCGDSTLPAHGSGNSLQVPLVQGDVIKAGSFDVIVGYSTGTGSYSGMGYVIVPWLANAKVEVRFTSITLALDKKLLTGIIETTYDPSESGIDDIDEYVDIFTSGYGVGGVVSGEVTADTTFGFVIKIPDGISVQLPTGYNPATGLGQGVITISVIPQGGGTPVSYTLDQLPTTIKDKDGNLYQVNKQGQVVPLGKPGGMALLDKTNTKNIDVDKAVVKFVDYPDKQVYAFDEWKAVYKKSNSFNKEYERLNGDYYVNAKAIAPGKTDYLKAVVTITDNSIIADSIKFVNGKGTIYSRTKLSNGIYEIAVVGGPEKDAQEVYALYEQAGAKTLNLGKVLVASYPRREYEVNLVPVNSDIQNLQELTDAVNKIYNQVNIEIKIKKLDQFNDLTWDINNNGKLDLSGDVLLSQYSTELAALKNNYTRLKGIESGKSYIFILNSADELAVNGEMPRGKSFGVLFTNNTSNKGIVLSHEISHGIFKLKHSFDGYGFDRNELVENLMDYSLGQKLSKCQWDLLHDPALALGILDSEDDAKSYVVKSLPASFLNSDNATYTFITYGGQTINIPKEATDFVFHFGVQTYEGSHHMVTGVLQQFKHNNVNYTVDFSGGISYKGSNGVVYANPTIAQGEKAAIMGMPNEESLMLYKFNITNSNQTSVIGRYNSNVKVFISDEANFPLKPFSGDFYVLKDAAQVPITFKLSGQSGPQWAYDDIIYKKVHGFAEKSEILYVSKIAQLRRAYSEYFNHFTSDGEDWFYPEKVKVWNSYNPYQGTQYIDVRPGIWGKKIEAENSTLPQLFNNKVEYYKLMLSDLRTYISTELQKRETFFNNLSATSNLNDVIKYVNNSSDYECSQLLFEKVKILLDILVRNHDDYVSPPHQKAIVKVLKNVPSGNAEEFKTYLEDVNVILKLEENLYDINDEEKYYSRYIDAMRNLIASLPVPTANEILANGKVFQHVLQGYEEYTRIALPDLHSSEPRIDFFYDTKGNFVPPVNAGPEYRGNATLGYFERMLLRLNDDYTFNNQIVFKKSDYPNGVMLSGLELYWLRKEQYNYLKASFNSHMLAGYGLVLTGPELAIAKGWRLVLAIADFQWAFKSFANTTPQFQQLLLNHPNLKSYSDAWDQFNAIYGACRLTQASAELAISRWANVKTAANNIKNDASISSTIKNDLKINQIVEGVVNPNLFNSLKAKITQQGYDILQAWKANKTLSFVDEFGETVTGSVAETKIFTELDNRIGNQKVIGTFRDDGDRLLVQCEGANRNTVYGVFKNQEGKYIVYEFKPAYKPSANPNVNVPLSVNKIAPNYAGTPYLYPISGTTRLNVVKIKMSGYRNSVNGIKGDFELANEAAGFTGKTAPKYVTPAGVEIPYTWHHLDDFDPVTGECTMQLVKSDAHTSVEGMTHCGSVSQYKAYYGTGYSK